MNRDAHGMANSIRMQRSAEPNMAFMIVEGSTDSRFFGRMMSKCTMMHFENSTDAKGEALKAIDLLETRKIAGVVAVLDADFMRLDGNTPASANVCLTDGHDVEGMLIQSPALDKLLAEWGREEKLKNIDPRELILNACKPIGLLRWFNHQHKHGLNFKEMEFKSFIDRRTLTTDETKLIEKVMARSKLKLSDDAQSFMKEKNEVAEWEVCQGHDLCKVLALGLTQLFGTQKLGKDGVTLIEKSLRIAYETAWFSGSQLARRLLQWQEANQPYQLFA